MTAYGTYLRHCVERILAIAADGFAALVLRVYLMIRSRRGLGTCRGAWSRHQPRGRSYSGVMRCWITLSFLSLAGKQGVCPDSVIGLFDVPVRLWSLAGIVRSFRKIGSPMPFFFSCVPARHLVTAPIFSRSVDRLDSSTLSRSRPSNGFCDWTPAGRFVRALGSIISTSRATNGAVWIQPSTSTAAGVG